MPRPSLLTDAARSAIVASIEAGNFHVTAADAAGIGERTLTTWLSRGRQEDERLDLPGVRAKRSEEPYRRLWADAQRARARAEVDRVAEIQAAASGGAVVETRTTTYADGRTEVVERRQAPDWRAAAWCLEHGPAGSRWRRSDKGEELSGPEGGATREDTTDVRADLLATIARMREKIGPQSTNGNGNGNGTGRDGTAHRALPRRLSPCRPELLTAWPPTCATSSTSRRARATAPSPHCTADYGPPPTCSTTRPTPRTAPPGASTSTRCHPARALTPAG